MNSAKKLLAKPIWNYHDIMAYSGFQKSKAYEIMKDCIKRYGGGVKNCSTVVTRDSVLSALGTTLEREIYVNDVLSKGGRNGTKLHKD